MSKNRRPKFTPSLNTLTIALLAITVIYSAFILHTPSKSNVAADSKGLLSRPGNQLSYGEIGEIEKPTPFPVGVDPVSKKIFEEETLSDFIKYELASNHFPRHSGSGWWQKVQAQLAMWSWYQNLASPTGRILVIQSGQKQTQIVNNIAKVMGWNNEQRQAFTDTIGDNPDSLKEGVFYPGKYTVERNASPEEVANIIYAAYLENIGSRYPEELAGVLSINEIMTLASLIEREAYDFNDMRYISGIIWNRLFIDMKLQLDATLQYAKAQNNGLVNWPKPLPADKFIDSPYNTYQKFGLPPAPIASPSMEAVVAALNPRQTPCVFYFHDSRGRFYCNETYAGHVRELREVFGTRNNTESPVTEVTTGTVEEIPIESEPVLEEIKSGGE